MRTNEFSLLGTELGLTAYGSTLCGVVDGWPLTLWNNNVNHVHLIVDRKRDSALVKQINAVLKTWGGKINSSFRYWLKQLVIDGEHLTDEEVRRIYYFATNGKLELQSNASAFITMCRIAAKET